MSMLYENVDTHPYGHWTLDTRAHINTIFQPTQIMYIILTFICQAHSKILVISPIEICFIRGHIFFSHSYGKKWISLSFLNVARDSLSHIILAHFSLLLQFARARLCFFQSGDSTKRIFRERTQTFRRNYIDFWNERNACFLVHSYEQYRMLNVANIQLKIIRRSNFQLDAEFQLLIFSLYTAQQPVIKVCQNISDLNEFDVNCCASYQIAVQDQGSVSQTMREIVRNSQKMRIFRGTWKNENSTEQFFFLENITRMCHVSSMSIRFRLLCSVLSMTLSSSSIVVQFIF